MEFSLKQELCAQPGKAPGTAPGNQQEGKIHDNSKALGYKERRRDLPNIVEYRSQNTADPEGLFRDKAVEWEHSQQTERPACRTV